MKFQDKSKNFCAHVFCGEGHRFSILVSSTLCILSPGCLFGTSGESNMHESFTNNFSENLLPPKSGVSATGVSAYDGECGVSARAKVIVSESSSVLKEDGKGEASGFTSLNMSHIVTGNEIIHLMSIYSLN